MMNKFLNVVLRESPLDSPFVPKAKCEGYGPLTGMIGSILGFGNYMAQQEANQTNLAIAKGNQELQRETNALNEKLIKETNKQNYKIFQEQNAFTEDMWNKQNAYNAPYAQVQRMLAAGLNPSAMFGQTTPASSVQSSQAHEMKAPQNVAPTLNYQAMPASFGNIGGEVLQNVNAFYDNQLKNEQAKKVAADGQISAVNAQFQTQRNMLELTNLRAEIDKKLADTKLSESTREYYESMREQIDQALELQKAQWNDLIVKEGKNNALTDASTKNQLAQAASHRANSHLTNIIAKYQPQLMQSNINLNESNALSAMENIAVMIQEGRLKSAQAASQELQNLLDIPKIEYELAKNKVKNKKWLKDIIIGIDLATETLFKNISVGANMSASKSVVTK